MSHAKTGGRMTRRRFVGTAAALAMLAQTGMDGSDRWLAPAMAGEAATASSEDRVAYTYHQGHCGGMCPLKCTVRGGRLVKIEPNDACDDRRQTICLKGLAEVQHIYGTGRVQAPLRRVGERGSNEFEQVTWDEALDEIVEKILAIQGESGKDAVVVTTTSESDFGFLQALLGAQGRGATGIDTGYGNGLDQATGIGWGYAMSTPEARDWQQSKLVLTVGSNYCESTLPQSRLFFEAKEAGARMVTVDPHFSTTASKSDEWLPIEPGTDAALYLGMINHIVAKGLIDEEFACAHTSLPFLVDASTGMLIRGEAAEEGAPTVFYVVDAQTGEAVPASEAANVLLEGSATIDGVEARTVYGIMLERIADCTPTWAEGITGIPAARIEALAEEYAEGPSSLAVGWGGNDKISNADIAGHAAALLVALTGNIGKPGAGVGVYVGAIWNCATASLGGWALPAEIAAAANEMPTYDMREGGSKARALIACGDDLCQHYANMGKTEDWARSLDLIVSIDPYFTEGCKWADYVLPCTTRFEYDEDFGNIMNGYSQIMLQERVVEPLFEARTDLWIQRQIAERLGLAEALPPTARDRADAILANSPDPAVAALTVEDLAAGQGVWSIEGADEVRRVLTDLAFPTESGRMDVYYENMLPFGQELPVWEPPVEAYAGNPLRETYPLQLTNARSRFRIHGQFQDSAWIQQIYVPTIDANPADLAEAGVQTGDEVVVRNDRGEMRVYVRANESIRPGSARMYENASGDFTLGGNLQSLTNDELLDRGRALMAGPVQPFSDTLVTIEKA